jgi:PAS domain S-box-containing protein
MKVKNKVSIFFKNLIQIASDDSDDARRRRLLNIILVGVFTLTILLLIFVGVLAPLTSQVAKPNEMMIIFAIGAGLLVGTGIIYAINRRVVGETASIIFLIFLTAIFNFADSPNQLSNGRSLVLFAIPIIMASILLRPVLSFVFAVLVSLDVFVLAVLTHSLPNFPAIAVFFMLALISWLSSRSLEQALKDLRTTNANLDRLVQERTRELAEALSRERIESGRNKAILESIADGVIVFDPRGNAIIANPASARLLHLREEEIIGASWNDLSRTKALDAHNRGIFIGLLTNPGQQMTNYRIQWGKKTLSITAAQVFETENKPIGTVAVLRDYTREAEVEKMKSTFLAIVSHELRTPLNAILGYAEMIKEKIYGPTTEKQHTAAERIMNNSQRLLDIVSDLLDQAQIEAGKLTIQMRPFRPAELIEAAQGLLEKAAAEKGLKLTAELDPAVPETMTGDFIRLQQILVNLINNAIKYTETGSIQIRVFRPDSKHWSMEVLDTGEGIPPESLPYIFEAFRQADSSTTRKHGGFGLGLSIVKQLVELMNGEVTVSSKLGVGSIFTITLPILPVRR